VTPRMKPLDRALQAIRLRAVLPYVEDDARVLDIGCATGALARVLGPTITYVGIDPDAPDEGTEARRFVRDVFPTLALSKTETFTLIVATAVLEHVSRADHAMFAAACADHLAPGGALAVTVPAPSVDTLLRWLKRFRLAAGMRDEQHYGFTPESTPGIFEPHGFTLQHHRRFELGLNHLFVFRRH
jgi:2-polyprenyl-3-methyl-5-hydroxy-6-metoxy-1,4-benzoquinol methylase